MESLAAITPSLLIPFLISPSALAQNHDYSFAPISMPIKDVSLSNNAALRGISLRAGTPKQRFSVLPMLYVPSPSLSLDHAGAYSVVGTSTTLITTTPMRPAAPTQPRTTVSQNKEGTSFKHCHPHFKPPSMLELLALHRGKTSHQQHPVGAKTR